MDGIKNIRKKDDKEKEKGGKESRRKSEREMKG